MTVIAYDENNNKINVEDYDKLIHKIIKCKKAHELIYISPIRKIKHFRHKNNDEKCKYNIYHMTEWHKKWQERLADVGGKKEIVFEDNRADITFNNFVIEFQHSDIKKK